MNHEMTAGDEYTYNGCHIRCVKVRSGKVWLCLTTPDGEVVELRIVSPAVGEAREEEEGPGAEVKGAA